MTNGQKSSNTALGLLIFVLFLSLAGLMAFKTGVLDISSFKKKPTYNTELIKTVSFRGPVKAKDLNLSHNEVRSINQAVLKNKTTFSGMILELDVWEYMRPIKVDSSTLLDMVIVLDIDPDCEVRSWNSKISRTDLVPQMVRYIEKCAGELKRYNDNPDIRNSPEMKKFKRIYM